MFKSAKVNRLSQNIVQQIRDAILAGNLKPGDRLPSEKELADNFGVSKSSLREAFRALEALGFLEVRQGMTGGAFVREVDLKTARNSLFNYIFFQKPSINEFTQLRSFIEPPIAEIAARKITDGDLADLEQNLVQTKKELDSAVFFYDLDTYFHHKLASIAGNRIIIFVIDSVKSAVVNLKLQMHLDANFSRKVYEAHVEIFDALHHRDPEKARSAMLNHIVEVDEMLESHRHELEKSQEANTDKDSPTK